MRLPILFLALASLAQAAPKTGYLTFDDGPEPGTAEVLQLLKDHKDAQGTASPITATFFVLGKNQSTFPGTAAEEKAEQKKQFLAIKAAGHRIGNHTFSHFPLTKPEYTATYSKPLTAPQRTTFRKNFDANLTHFRGLVGDAQLQLKLARLPGAGGVLQSLEYLRAETNDHQLKHVTWTFEFAPNGVLPEATPSENWQGIQGVAATYATFPPDNAVILFHDRHWAGTAGIALLDQIIKKLDAHEFKFVLVEE